MDSVKLVPQIAEVLNAIQPGEVVQVFEE